MICFEDKLDSAINGLCPTILGMENNGYLLSRSDVANRSITDFVASFIPTSPAIPVYHPLNDLAYKPKSEGTTNGYGLTKFEKSIELFILANTELSQTQLMQLKNNNAEWVFVGIQKDGQIVVFGFERGLKLKTSMQEFNSLDTHGGIVLTFDETAVNTPMLFSNTTSLAWFTDYDLIYGGTIATGVTVRFTVDTDKIGYVKLPNGTVLTTSSGSVINYVYTGVGGAITYYIPKNSVVCEVNEPTEGVSLQGGYLQSSRYGAIYAQECRSITGINFPNTSEVNAYNGLLLTDMIAPLATTVYMDSSSLTAKSIGDYLVAAKENNPNANGACNFSGGLNANKTAIAVYMGLADGAALDTWVIDNLPNFSISFKP